MAPSIIDTYNDGNLYSLHLLKIQIILVNPFSHTANLQQVTFKSRLLQMCQ